MTWAKLPYLSLKLLWTVLSVPRCLFCDCEHLGAPVTLPGHTPPLSMCVEAMWQLEVLSIKLVHQWTPGSACFCLPTSRIKSMCFHDFVYLFFYTGSEDWIQPLELAKQTLYQLGYLPSSSKLIIIQVLFLESCCELTATTTTCWLAQKCPHLKVMLSVTLGSDSW
jgi:hypothetical protein